MVQCGSKTRPRRAGAHFGLINWQPWSAHDEFHMQLDSIAQQFGWPDTMAPFDDARGWESPQQRTAELLLPGRFSHDSWSGLAKVPAFWFVLLGLLFFAFWRVLVSHTHRLPQVVKLS